VTAWRDSVGIRRGALTIFFLLAFLCITAGGVRKTITASCNPSCTARPGTFEVKTGTRAERFVIVVLKAGRRCGDAKKFSRAGFCIKKGDRVVYTYYEGKRGIVSDPVPLEDLVLESGRYSLFAAEAKNALVRLALDVVETGKRD